MKKDKKVEGISAKDMGLKELKELAVSLKLLNPGEDVEKLSKKVLLAKVNAFEKDAIEAKKAAGVTPTPKTTLNAPDLGMYQDKKVTKRTPITINGKEYIDILVESGETFREEVK